MIKKHLLVRIRNTNDINLFKLLEPLEMVMDEFMLEMNMNVLSKSSHQFQPFGATLLYLLQESHCSIHTFWEDNEAYLDLFCCRDFSVETALESLRLKFGTEQLHHQEVFR